MKSDFRILAALIGLCAPAARAYYTQLGASYTPDNFFSQFNFYTQSDPTHGFVQYVDQGTAQSGGLIRNDGSSIYMGVDHTNAAPSGRKSVRITSKASFTHGLFILDLTHMPGGICGTWPAYWTVGPNWPNGGEIDIIEGVNANTQNSMTLHTTDGCTISGSDQTGNVMTTNCYIDAPGQSSNAGCGVMDARTNSYGTGFNNNKGGVYATEWNSDAIKVWFFPRGSIPSDVLGANPAPENWGTPAATFSGGCNIDSHFSAHQIVFDTTFCGDWAGSVWGSNAQCAGLASSCNDYVANNPSAFSNAYWQINSLKVFTS